MRALKVLVIVMAVMIVAGVVTLGVVITRRMSSTPATAPISASVAPLDEPAGTHIAQITASGDRMLMLLQGGGPDRVVVLDLRTGQVLSRAGLLR